MKVLNLRCEQEHRFEGWFASELDFQSQMERSLLACPICDCKVVVRLPSAPRLHVSRAAPPSASAPAAGNGGEPATAATVGRAGSAATGGIDPHQQAQAHWLRAVQHVLKNTEDVGDRFPEEARRIHYGEAKERGIRGHASKEDAQALKDEGIEVNALPVPEALKGPLQ